MTSKARRTLAVAAAVFILAAPSAPAMPMDSQTSRPAHVAQSIGMEYRDLRVSEPTVVAAPAPASSGFDWTAAGIGALVATGLAVVSLTALRLRRPVGRRVVA